MKKAGLFLKWIGGDVKKESVDELEASGFEWSDIAKLVNVMAIKWFKDCATVSASQEKKQAA